MADSIEELHTENGVDEEYHSKESAHVEERGEGEEESHDDVA